MLGAEEGLSQELRQIWKEMVCLLISVSFTLEVHAAATPQGWRRNVKARLFMTTIRDHFGEIHRQKSAAMATAMKKDPTLRQRTDAWALDYISVLYLQPIMEAFDDDGSGYVTVAEVNTFVDAVPSSIKWRSVHFACS